MIQKAKDCIRPRLIIIQLVTFIFGKLFFGVVQIPNYKDNIPHYVFLMIGMLFFMITVMCKTGRHWQAYLKIKSFIMMQLSCFLIWIVTLLVVIFGWSLSDTLGWNFFQKNLLLSIQIYQTFIFTLVAQWNYICRAEFICYEIVLAISIFALALKTVIFIAYDDQASNKDIVLLTLTTQIALSIIIMDTIQRSYSRRLEKKQIQWETGIDSQRKKQHQFEQRQQQMKSKIENDSRLEAEMVINA